MDPEAVSLPLKLIAVMLSLMCEYFDVKTERCDTRDGVSLAA